MADVEPQGGKADEVNGQYPQLAKSCLQVERAVHDMVTHHLGQLHLGPELHEVQNQEAANDKTQNEHVLRSPLDILGLGGHSIAVIATCLAVLERENEREDDVNCKAACQDQRTQQK